MNNNKIASSLHFSQQRSKILSAGMFLPDQIVKSDDLFAEFDSQEKYGLETDWMSRFLGIKERRMADSSALPSELAIPAAREALDRCGGVNLDHIDSIYFCGIERDQPEPATAHVIQEKLGLAAHNVMDISNACFGFVEGMRLAAKDIALGDARLALVVTGETPTKILNGVMKLLKEGVSLEKAKSIIGALTVGDAGGAVVLGPTDSDDPAGFRFFNVVADSEHYKKCIYKMGEDGIPRGQMQMGPISLAAFDHHKAMIKTSLNDLNCSEFDWTLLHQTGSRQFARITGLPGIDRKKVIKSFDVLGNITTATFPVNYYSLQKSGRVKSGDKLGCCFAGSGLVIGHFGYVC